MVIPSYPCPSKNSTQHVLGSSPYVLVCGTNFAGADLPAVHADTLGDCILACDEYKADSSTINGALCVAVTFRDPIYTDNNCYPKYQIPSDYIDFDPMLSSARRVGYVYDGDPVFDLSELGQDPSSFAAPVTATITAIPGTSDSFPTGSSAATTATSSGSQSTPSTPSENGAASGQSGISTGAGIGIGLGIGIPILLAVAAVLFYMQQRNKRKRPLSPVSEVQEIGGQDEKTFQAKPTARPQELKAHDVPELEGHARVEELD